MFPPTKEGVPHSVLLLIAAFVKYDVVEIEDVWDYLSHRLVDLSIELDDYESDNSEANMKEE
jgi:hypothetical protein